MEKYFNAFINLFRNILGIFEVGADASEVLKKIQDEINNFLEELAL